MDKATGRGLRPHSDALIRRIRSLGAEQVCGPNGPTMPMLEAAVAAYCRPLWRPLRRALRTAFARGRRNLQKAAATEFNLGHGLLEFNLEPSWCRPTLNSCEPAFSGGERSESQACRPSGARTAPGHRLRRPLERLLDLLQGRLLLAHLIGQLLLHLAAHPRLRSGARLGCPEQLPHKSAQALFLGSAQ